MVTREITGFTLTRDALATHCHISQDLASQFLIAIDETQFDRIYQNIQAALNDEQLAALVRVSVAQTIAADALAKANEAAGTVGRLPEGFSVSPATLALVDQALALAISARLGSDVAAELLSMLPRVIEEMATEAPASAPAGETTAPANGTDGAAVETTPAAGETPAAAGDTKPATTDGTSAMGGEVPAPAASEQPAPVEQPAAATAQDQAAPLATEQQSTSPATSEAPAAPATSDPAPPAAAEAAPTPTPTPTPTATPAPAPHPRRGLGRQI